MSALCLLLSTRVSDAIEGVCLRTKTLLRQALAKRIKPIIINNNKIDQLLALNLSKEGMFQSFKRIIEDVNTIICTYHDVVSF